jgi:hypothetical protein
MPKVWSRRLGAARAGSGWTAASGRDLERIECRELAQSCHAKSPLTGARVPRLLCLGGGMLRRVFRLVGNLSGCRHGR